ncbi:hypothetical protein [Diaphorobacter aerolatus]|uniref:Uncharacterized protein n=1 Tax=Diaphorobacter aerolatus TaxID=1288495 RepID=A0A7H0GJM9_9BURK|nr:hypothetical protein [Diaphorobacter aerolatus]QNP48495.1 hypothetical protein H9K75_21665 [Diaphorobacter aerolatus]
MYSAFTPEAQIVVAICAFYLYDACITARVNEGLLLRGWRGWRCRLGVQGLEARRKFLLWPALMRPHLPVYRLNWQNTDLAMNRHPKAVEAMQADATTYRAFRVPIYLLALALLVILPVTLLGHMGDVARLCAVLLVYLFTACLSVMTWRYGSRHDELRAQARSLSLQVLLCPPFALNVVRKLSLLHVFACSLPEAAMRVLPREDWQATALALHTQIADEIEAEEPGETVARLRASRDGLAAHLPPAEV